MIYFYKTSLKSTLSNLKIKHIISIIQIFTNILIYEYTNAYKSICKDFNG